MRTMTDYTIYCTEEQTKKALELGAKIKFKTLCHYDLQNGKFIPYPDLDIDVNGEPILIPPTAEQMIGWLEEQGVWIHFCKPNKRPNNTSYSISNMCDIFNRIHIGGEYNSRKEATLAAIDAALDYLSKNKKCMEHAIGTRITLDDGRVVEVVEIEQDSCEGCIFMNEVCFNLPCFAKDRTDHKNIIYKEIKDMDTSYEKYLQEKAFLEAWGHTSVITYEEWKEIKEETK